jgi:hypothetical protein
MDFLEGNKHVLSAFAYYERVRVYITYHMYDPVRRYDHVTPLSVRTDGGYNVAAWPRRPLFSPFLSGQSIKKGSREVSHDVHEFSECLFQIRTTLFLKVLYHSSLLQQYISFRTAYIICGILCNFAVDPRHTQQKVLAVKTCVLLVGTATRAE